MKTPPEILARTQAERRIIQDFRICSESVEWELSRLYFFERGSDAFATATDHVPFEINNDGNLSAQTARFFVESCQARHDAGTLPDELHVLELGAGTGLFARFFLDALRDSSLAGRLDVYGRVRYVLSDRSPKMLEDVRRAGVLAGHEARIVLAEVDALDPARGLPDTIGPAQRCLDAVFANYVLDVLPTLALRRREARLQVLHVRTCLARDVDLREYGTTYDELRRRIESDDPEDRRRLIDLHPLFALEYEYRDLEGPIPYAEFLEGYDVGGGEYLLFNHGALACLERLSQMLRPGGFVVVNDYGQISADQGRENQVHQRFSGCVASELNFPLLRAFGERVGLQWCAPEEDAPSIHTRLLSYAAPEPTFAAFRRGFGRRVQEELRAPLIEARAHAAEGRTEQALAAYERAVARQPYNWLLLDEVARFLMLAVGDFRAALEMTEWALKLNPSFAGSLWCHLGDCRLALGLDAAREAYERALAIDAGDARAQFGLGLCHAREFQLGAALHRYAAALANDRWDQFREQVIEHQRLAIQGLRRRSSRERTNLADRVARRIQPGSGRGTLPPLPVLAPDPVVPEPASSRGWPGPRTTATRLVLENGQSPGDIVMLTAAVRDLHACYPGEFTTDVRTPSPELWEHNPHLSPLEPQDPGVRVLKAEYPLIHRCNDVPCHFIQGFIEDLNDKLGLRIRPTRFAGDIHLSAEEKGWVSQVEEHTRLRLPFWLVAVGGKQDFTIKWWDPARYQAVVDHFRDRLLFVQVGARGHHHPVLDGVLDLVGQTSLRQLVRLVYHAQGILTPVSLLMHLAAAVELPPDLPLSRPCVVVAGGREPPHWEAYPHHAFLHTVGQLACCARGGCWRSRTVPLGDGDEKDRPEALCVDVVNGLPRCMDRITAGQVIAAIEAYLAGGALPVLSSAQATAARVACRLQRARHEPAISASDACPQPAGRTAAIPRGSADGSP